MPGIKDPRPTIHRFLDRTEITEGCWFSLCKLNADGYAEISHNGRQTLAHRYIYEALVKPIPAGMRLDHKCRVRHCVNPLHLEIVTHEENTRRGESFSARNSRKTHCPQGHPYDAENTYPAGTNGRGRGCKACRKARRTNGKAAKAATLTAQSPLDAA